MTSFGSVRFKEEELQRPEKWCLWQKSQRIIHHRVFLCGAVIKPKWDCTSLVIYFTDHYTYTNSITLLHFYSAIHYSTSHTISTCTEMQPSLGKRAANCRAQHRGETLQIQISRNSQAKQEKDNIKKWNWTLRDGQLSQRIVLHRFCLPDAPFDLDIRSKRGRLNTLALSSRSDQHQRHPPELPGWNSLSVSRDPWALHWHFSHATGRKRLSVQLLSSLRIWDATLQAQRRTYCQISRKGMQFFLY